MARIIHAIAGFPNIPAGFPIILTNSLEIIEPLFRYLIDVATIPGRSHSPETLRTYAEHLLDFFDTLENASIPWDQVTQYIIASYRNNLLENPSLHTHRPYAKATINARIRAIYRFYEWAHTYKLIPKLPFHVEHVRASARRRPFLTHPPDELFLNAHGQRVTPQRATRKFAKAFRSANVRASLHCLRHTYAINTYNALFRESATNTSLNPLKTLQTLLGHESIATTAVYLHSLDLDTNTPPPEIAYLSGEAIDDQYSPPAE